MEQGGDRTQRTPGKYILFMVLQPLTSSSLSLCVAFDALLGILAVPPFLHGHGTPFRKEMSLAKFPSLLL